MIVVVIGSRIATIRFTNRRQYTSEGDKEDDLSNDSSDDEQMMAVVEIKDNIILLPSN